MRLPFRLELLATVAAFAFLPNAAQAQTTLEDDPVSATGETTGDPVTAEDLNEGLIVVTARKREETLQDVPIAVTAIDGDVLAARGFNSVREAAALAPGLNINSDGGGRAFVAIRGVGVTLVQSVQPGVGLFVDGIYRPNTAYLNNPLLDVERIEVLRGPQGTLYGKNTLGGAINVITRQPGNYFEGRASASYAGPDDQLVVAGSISAPIIDDRLAVRIAASHQEQDGFIRNTLLNADGNPLNSNSVNGTVRFTPAPFTLTINGYYDGIDTVNTPYSRVAGPDDYSREIVVNSLNRVEYRYRGVNAKLEMPLEGMRSNLTLIGAIDARDSATDDADADFGSGDFVRSTGGDDLRTKTAELRLDTQFSDTLSTLFGLFYSREEVTARDVSTIKGAFTGLPFDIVRSSTNETRADTYAVFGTLFWEPSPEWEVSLGLRYDHEDRTANGSVITAVGPLPPSGGPLPEATLESDQVQPKLTVTRNWTPGLMTYASIARGYRGGGFNAPTAPFRTYNGDSAWTYEVGGKFASFDDRASFAAAVFYNDYSDYIGLNSIAPAAGGGLVTVDLNSGDVESYGLELEGFLRPVPAWTITGGLTLLHARLTDTTPYTELTGRTLSSDRLTFQPDWMANLATEYTFDLGGDSEFVLSANVTGKGERLAGTLNETTPTFLDSYWLVGAAATYRQGPFEVAAFVRNALQEDYWESYIEQTTLLLAGLPASDLGIMGDARRYGVRASMRF
ncbi:TonB-dependent receptor [Altererythrobacter sp. SALINAS58]|uniref:TonB-dependent receptor n=1 Tax=Alteripontixanthobacter muriae TaxID=2705546 RepID=UPI0015761A7D|nr:TonB-dependent receptor [Alteripontixanthobacter muriae]NTZ43199.1 TonB-dependent receptor [Alteripontixanthobacter muriae]